MEVIFRWRNVSFAVLIVWLVDLHNQLGHVAGHGMLLDPPSRSSLWRFRDKNPTFENVTENWTDNELYCGGRTIFLETGKCGICGDNYTDPVPRQNEDGGIYGLGIIARTYKAGQVIPIKANLTASHYGYFEMRLCAKDDISSHLQESCYEKHLLEIISSSNKDAWLLNNGWIEAKFARDAEDVEDQDWILESKKFKKLRNSCGEPSTTPKSTEKTRRTTRATTTRVTKKPTTSVTSTRKTKKPTIVETTTKITNKPTRRPLVTSTTQGSIQMTTTKRILTAGEKPKERITKYYISTATSHPQGAPAEHTFGVRLPKGVKCNHCVLQWQYTTGNDWGTCDDGTKAIGCGRQETFRNCADVAIL